MIRSLKLCLPIVLMNYLSIVVHVLRIVQLMTGFDRITKDNEHLLRLHAVMVLSKRSSHDYDL